MNITALLAQAVPEGRVFGLDSQTLASAGIQLLNAIILAVALTFILYKPVKQFLQNRADKIKGKMDETDSAMEKANQLIAEYENKLKEIDIEGNKIIEDARRKAAEESKAIVEGARMEAQEIKRRTQESINEERRRFKEESRLYIIEVASLMAEKIIAKTIDDETQDKLFEEALTQLEHAPWQG